MINKWRIFCGGECFYPSNLIQSGSLGNFNTGRINTQSKKEPLTEDTSGHGIANYVCSKAFQKYL